jgi:membrane associated rhomboid family serine protease
MVTSCLIKSMIPSVRIDWEAKFCAKDSAFLTASPRRRAIRVAGLNGPYGRGPRDAESTVCFAYKPRPLKRPPRSPKPVCAGNIDPPDSRPAMIPFGDSEASHRITPATAVLILANVAVFALELRLGAHAEPLIWRLALIPARLVHWHRGGLHPWAIASLVASLFMHAGALHLTGNMLFLLIFGPAVEQAMGGGRFIAFYLSAGVAAGLALTAMSPESRVAVIGASGAIAGVLGAYMMLYPGGRIYTFVEVPAIFYLLAWFALQLGWGISSGARGPLIGGVAWWAHVGGFLFGVASAPIFAVRQVKSRRAQAARRR